MWYKYADKGFDVVEKIAEQVANMNPYDVQNHINIMMKADFDLDSPLPRPGGDIEERLNSLKTMATPMRAYLSIYPQIYLYPNEASGRWHYLVYDPTDINSMADETLRHHKEFKTNIPIDSDVDEVIQMTHKHYPTAIIDHYYTEEEKRRDD